VRPGQRKQPRRETLGELFQVPCRTSQGLSGDGLHRRQQILDAMVQLGHEQCLSALRALTRGDVLNYRNRAQRLAVRVPGRDCSTRPHPDDSSVWSNIALFDLCPAGVVGGGESCSIDGTVVGMADVVGTKPARQLRLVRGPTSVTPAAAVSKIARNSAALSRIAASASLRSVVSVA
jgi:hypothetical protein